MNNPTQNNFPKEDSQTARRHTGGGPSPDGAETQADTTGTHVSPPRGGEPDQAGGTGVAEESGKQEPWTVSGGDVTWWSYRSRGVAGPQAGKHRVLTEPIPRVVQTKDLNAGALTKPAQKYSQQPR